ncbi:hypothetical protein J4H65_05740 [Vibrio alginolyticus]|uniref:hypothetical protein n=1 Tax=Vibrio alginolyticus TaxID=663 RepID=UPI001BD4E157|nr:hypothetical protein [Vibrio alginolyticus]EKZ9011135.1 hypothetical protein [Vibrio alginolyticus]MBT0074781.1 hypothetical protein [Vibrio alginolyticus]
MPIGTIINIAAAVFALIEVCRYLLVCFKNKVNPRLETAVSNALAASSIPMGIALTIAGFDPTIVNQLEGLNIYFTLAGVSLLFVTFRALFGKA